MRVEDGGALRPYPRRSSSRLCPSVPAPYDHHIPLRPIGHAPRRPILASPGLLPGLQTLRRRSSHPPRPTRAIPEARGGKYACWHAACGHESRPSTPPELSMRFVCSSSPLFSPAAWAPWPCIREISSTRPRFAPCGESSSDTKRCNASGGSKDAHAPQDHGGISWEPRQSPDIGCQTSTS